MSLGDVFNEWDCHYKALVMFETFGHLMPERRKVYNGEVLFAYGEYGAGACVLRDGFPELSGPWWATDLNDFVYDQSQKMKLDSGEIAKFVGTYTMFKNGKCRFSGKVSKVKL